MGLFEPSLLLVTALSVMVYGATDGLMAMGLSLIYSTIRVVNFAHGTFYMLGAMVAWSLTTPYRPGGTTPQTGLTGWALPFALGLLGVIALGFTLGAGMQRGLLERLLRRPGWVLTTLVATLAMGTILEGGAYLIFGAGLRPTAQMVEGAVRVGSAVIEYAEMGQLGIAVGGLGIVHLFLKRSRYGLALRAVAQDREVAELCRVPTQRVYLLAFGVGGALASLAGTLLTNVVYVDVVIGHLALLYAFIIVVFGGIGSVKGTLIAAFVIAVMRVSVTFVFDAAWALVVALGLMVAVLVVRPQGLFGFRE
jgi:branched-chain amino acid transport system permease protein